MDDGVLGVSARLMGWDEWDRCEVLPGGRNQVAVVWKGGDSYVVKAYSTSGPAGGARERAALLAFDGAAGTPRLLAEGDDPPCAVMTHLEGSVSLADLLLGSQPDPAQAALVGWADALAALHDAGTPERRALFSAGLAARAPGLATHALGEDFAEATARYADVIGELGLGSFDEALRELRELPAELDRRGHEVLTPADTCPDNNLIVDGGVRLIDYEHAQLRHAAWDVAYLHAPWPSCWCAWRIPDDPADAAVERYCEARGHDVADSAFRDDLALATLGWRLMSPGFFIAGALASDDRDIDPRRPSRRSFVLHRLGLAATMPGPGSLVALAGELHAALLDRWGSVPLEPAPAFRSAAETSRTVGP